MVGYDRFAPGHDRSAAGGETRIFRSAHFEDSRYVPLLKHADVLWEQLQRETGHELRRLTGCLLMGRTEHHQMATVLQSIAEHDLDHEVLDAESLANASRSTASRTATRPCSTAAPASSARS